MLGQHWLNVTHLDGPASEDNGCARYKCKVLVPRLTYHAGF